MERKGTLLLMLVEFEPSVFDLPLDIGSPIIRLLLAVEVIADGGIAFDADNGAPVASPVLVLSL